MTHMKTLSLVVAIGMVGLGNFAMAKGMSEHMRYSHYVDHQEHAQIHSEMRDVSKEEKAPEKMCGFRGC